VGNAAAVPTPISAREISNTQKLGAAAPMTPATSRMAAPLRNTRRGPKIVDSLPIVGCATALHRYRTEIRLAV
jgi:hypothetical protein